MQFNQAIKPASVVNASDLQTFLKLVAEGEQDKAEAMLKANPALALVPGEVIDLSKRKFTNITAFQYAVWALDWHMWTMIRKYLPDDEAKKQAEGFETGPWIREHGVTAQYLLEKLTNALQTAIDLYDKATDATFFKDKKLAEANTAWVQQVGGSQLLLPAHVINEYCHPTRSFKPCPNFRDTPVLPRTRTIDGSEWFTAVFNNGKLGKKFAWAHGVEVMLCVGGWIEAWAAARECCPEGRCVMVDRCTIDALTSTRTAQREELITELRLKHVQRKAA
jgi:hypothetical protein